MADEAKDYEIYINSLQSVESKNMSKYPFGDKMNTMAHLGDSFAKWLAGQTLMNKYKEDGKGSVNKEQIDADIKKGADAIKKTSAYKHLFREENSKEALALLYDDDPKLKIGREIQKDKGKIVMEFNALVVKHAQLDAEKRVYQKEILKDLEATKSSSFSAKLKSFFVGNSKEYNKAIKALEDVSKGVGDKDEAAKAIKAYLDIRKDKVRDHQYGRDRFDGMMKSLCTLMEPGEFKEYCMSVDAARFKRDPTYKGRTAPENYKTAEQKSHEREMLEPDQKNKGIEAKQESASPVQPEKRVDGPSA